MTFLYDAPQRVFNMITYTQAVAHLKQIRLFADDKNAYLSCVRTLLRNVKVDLLSEIRLDTVKDTDQLITLLDEIKRTEIAVDKFLEAK